jgi:hypothetical protein
LKRVARGSVGAALGLLLVAHLASCARRTEAVADANVTTLGSIEVTAQLVEIPGLEEWEGRFPSNDLGYDYVYVMKYRVLETHRGRVDSDTILVGHYNPLKPRSEAADARCEDVGGDLRRFHLDDVHRMALDEPFDDFYIGPMINKYFSRPEGEGPIYWPVWTNRVVR